MSYGNYLLNASRTYLLDQSGYYLLNDPGAYLLICFGNPVITILLIRIGHIITKNPTRMPLNYSKWDALQLSDDSDIECHPNVDKKSFIRLKQRQIHQQREERKIKIQQLKDEAGLNEILLSKINQLIVDTDNHGPDHLRNTASQLAATGASNPPSADQPPSIDQMVFNLITQILSKLAPAPVSDQLSIAQKELNFHLSRLSAREKKRQIELENEESESKKYITSDDVHDGFDVSYIDKTPSAAIDEPIQPPGNQTKSKKKVRKTSIEVLNPKSTDSSLPTSPPQNDSSEDDDSDDEDLPTLSPSAQKFAQITFSDYSASLSAIQSDPSLYLNESTTDALLVEAFSSEMKGKKTYAKNCVHQGLLLQYCRKLGRDGVSLFFKKVGSGEPKAMQVFIDDVNSTYDRIAKRCATIISERAQEPSAKEQIQLVPTNPTTAITFEVPDGPPPENIQISTEDPEESSRIDVEEVKKFLWERWNTFNGFPKKLQKALKSKELDKVNEVLGNMEVAEAEKVVQELDRVGILSFSEGGIIDATKPEATNAGPNLAEGLQQTDVIGASEIIIPDTTISP
ncbi:hypothetical protein O181_069155 [Austropuccinia psidii MF-1]|uniref:Hsp90 chaperone protein kinase-targeting subunit n=1 Tax=Austropuccinia psidii MF-1 TaxID=1389203 RepID=A0A9Q3ETX2_9BASI|nr:hypothetical protein [Austropuccinia psidii MF-1]